jgi:hypothetical protein
MPSELQVHSILGGDFYPATSGELQWLWLKFCDAGGARVANVTGVLGVIMIGMCF